MTPSHEPPIKSNCPRRPCYVYMAHESRILVRPIPGGGEGAAGWEMVGQRLPEGGDPADGWRDDPEMPGCGPMPFYEALHLANEFASARAQVAHARAEARFGRGTFTARYRLALRELFDSTRRGVEKIPEPRPEDLEQSLARIVAELRERGLDVTMHSTMPPDFPAGPSAQRAKGGGAMTFTLTLELTNDEYNDLIYAIDLARSDARNDAQRWRMDHLMLKIEGTEK